MCTLPGHPDNAPRPARQSFGIGSRRRSLTPAAVALLPYVAALPATRRPSRTGHSRPVRRVGVFGVAGLAHLAFTVGFADRYRLHP